MRLLFAIACAAVLLSSPLMAQDGLRSASLPERPRHGPLPADRVDQFRARTDTYQVRPQPLPVGGGFFGGGFFPGAQPVVIVVERVVERAPIVYRREMFEPRPEPPAERVPPAPAAPPVAAAPPPPPKTFYVIPGCYAGDRRPEPDQLPAGCDLRRLRIVPPR